MKITLAVAAVGLFLGIANADIGLLPSQDSAQTQPGEWVVSNATLKR